MKKFVLIVSSFLLVFSSFQPVQTQAQPTDFVLRFYGNGTDDIDRVKIPITLSNNIGGDFTIEFWMKSPSSANDSPVCTDDISENEWTLGNIIFDRDIFGAPDIGDFGVSLRGGRIAFGVANNNGNESLCTTSVDLRDNQWHHIAVTRNTTSGVIRAFVDGIERGSDVGPTGDVSYNFGRTLDPDFPNDPYFVIGAEKHDYDQNFGVGIPNNPSYNGFFDELRISDVVRYTSNFQRPSAKFANDPDTIAIFHFDEGSGTSVQDSSSLNNDGALSVGGTPEGPEFVASDAPIDIWNPWIGGGGSPSVITMENYDLVSGNRLYQAVRGWEGAVWTRFTEDGTTWEPWLALGGTPGEIAMKQFDNGSTHRLFQSIRGFDNAVWTRFIEGDVWHPWIRGGGTPGNIALETFDPVGPTPKRLYQAVRGIEGGVWTRYTEDSVTWSPFVLLGGTPGEISMLRYDPGTGERLYQAVRGWEGGAWTRYTTDGDNWTNWELLGGTSGNISMSVFDTGTEDRLYQSVRGLEGLIWTQYTDDGDVWSGWTSNGGTPYDVEMISYDDGFDERLYQAVRGYEGALWTRYSEDGDTWNAWEQDFYIAVNPRMAQFDGELYQAVTGLDKVIYTRRSK